jgi:hypothetical protein
MVFFWWRIFAIFAENMLEKEDSVKIPFFFGKKNRQKFYFKKFAKIHHNLPTIRKGC